MSEPLRLGVIGTGFIARVVAAALRETERLTLAAVSSREAARAHRFASELAPAATAFGDWQSLLEGDTVDAVYIATPTTAREAIAVAAAAARKHVLAEKPFASVESLRAITAACRANEVAFLDATHFVHHPRHALLRESLRDRVGPLLAIDATFTFPSMDHANVRHDPASEPTGAWGDMAWYVMRAIVEHTPDDTTLHEARAFARRDPVSGAIVNSAGVLCLSTGCTSTWNAAYDIGTCVQELHLMGPKGRVRLDDFVLDWAGGFGDPLPGHVAQFEQQSGPVNPSGVVVERVPSAQRQLVRMLDGFAALAADPTGEATLASMRASERTQALLDAAWRAHSIA